MAYAMPCHSAALCCFVVFRYLEVCPCSNGGDIDGHGVL